jgi:hypothetical protein
MRFVIRSTAADAQFIQAYNTTMPIAGIAGIGTRYPPYATLDDGLIAVAGENFRIFTPPQEEAALEVGDEAVATGAMLTSDALGRGVPRSNIVNYCGAQAIMAGQPGEVIIVKPLFGRGA